MADALNNFGVQWSSLLAQAFNFGILLIILYVFAYKRILKILDARTKRIADTEKDKKVTEQLLAKTKEDQQNVLSKANKEATKTIEGAKKTAEKLAQSIVNEAEENAKSIILGAEKEAKRKQKEMYDSLKEEIALLIKQSLENILPKDENKLNERLIDEAIESFSDKK